jgi:hypothetical protein
VNFQLIFPFIISNTKMYKENLAKHNFEYQFYLAKKGEMMKKQEEKTPNVSGTFQIVNDQQKEDLEHLQKQHNLDKESLHYARIFMED